MHQLAIRWALRLRADRRLERACGRSRSIQEQQMNARLNQLEATECPYISTGHLPPSVLIRALMTDAFQRYRSITEGENSQVYPALARVPHDLFGLCLVGTDGNVYAAGDAEYDFSIMS